jgi:hypothetical protein
LEVHGRDLTVGLSPTKMRQLCFDTRTLAHQLVCTGVDLARIVGRWTWAMLVVRPALSVFEAVYRFINTAGYSYFGVWNSVRRELLTACRLFPVLFATVHGDWFDRVVACDASMTGEGVVALLLLL